MAPCAGKVLIAGTDQHLLFRSRYHLIYTRQPDNVAHRPSIDILFSSVAAYWGKDATGVLLTGMGRDGAQGMLEIRQQGGKTIAQDQGTSAVFGMPKAAISLGAAQIVLPLQEIAEHLKY